MKERAYANGRHRKTPWFLLFMAWLAVAVLLGAHLYESRRAIEADQHDALVKSVNIIERNLAQQLQTTSNALESIRDDLPDLIRQPSFLDLRLQALRKTSVGIQAFSVVDRNGIVVASSQRELVGTSSREEAHYSVIRNGNDPSVLYVSEPYRTPSGEWVIALARGTPDAQGHFDGYAVAVIDPDYFERLLTSVLHAPDMRVGLTHAQGKVLYRIPDPEGITGKDLSGATQTPFFQHLQSGEPLSVITSDTSASGQNRMVATRTVWPESVKADRAISL